MDKKIINSIKVEDWEVLSDDGFVNIEYLHETIPYTVFNLKLSNDKELKCADNHIVFYKEGMEEVFVKDLYIGDKICVEGDGKLEEAEVVLIENLNYEETMYDLQLAENSKHRYYTNGILSHNTHLAKLIAKAWYDNNLVRIDMSEYQDKISSTALLGSPPGYVGYDQGGSLTEQVRRNPYSILLLDEIEKADKQILNTLLQVLDEGHATDAQGRKIDFKNCIIIMTSNLGAKDSEYKKPSFGGGQEVKLNDTSIEAARKHFTPELWNRIDQVIVFNPLVKEDMFKILELELNVVKDMLKTKKDIKVTFSKKLKDILIDKGFDPKLGARPLKRAVEALVIDEITEYLIFLTETPKKLNVNWDEKTEKVVITSEE